MQHVVTLLLVTVTPSIKRWVERESTARQSRQGHANTSGEIKTSTPPWFQVSALPVRISVQSSINSIALICSLQSRWRPDTVPGVSFSSWCWQGERQEQKVRQYFLKVTLETASRSYNIAGGKRCAWRPEHSKIETWMQVRIFFTTLRNHSFNSPEPGASNLSNLVMNLR